MEISGRGFGGNQGSFHTNHALRYLKLTLNLNFSCRNLSIALCSGVGVECEVVGHWPKRSKNVSDLFPSSSPTCPKSESRVHSDSALFPSWQQYNPGPYSFKKESWAALILTWPPRPPQFLEVLITQFFGTNSNVLWWFYFSEQGPWTDPYSEKNERDFKLDLHHSYWRCPNKVEGQEASNFRLGFRKAQHCTEHIQDQEQENLSGE